METSTYMPVAPTGGSFGGFGGDGWWIILLFLFMGFGGGFGGFGNNGAGFVGADVQRGFDQNSIMNGFTGIQNSITSGFGDIQNAIYGIQTNNMQQMFTLQSQLSQCCCDNRMATMQTQAVVQNEGAATRLAIQNQTQAILDRLCDQTIEQLREQNQTLVNQLAMANLAASQTAQTAEIISALKAA